MNRKQKPIFNINIDILRENHKIENEQYFKNSQKRIVFPLQEKLKILRNEITSSVNKVEVIKYYKNSKLDMENKKEEKNINQIKIDFKESNKIEQGNSNLKREKKAFIIPIDEIIANNLESNDNSIDRNNDNNSESNDNTTEDSGDINQTNIEVKRNEPIKSFNQITANFYSKHKLYDIPLNEENSDSILPEKYRINEKYFGFLYPNNLKTYHITISGFYINNEKKNDLEMKNENDEKFDQTLGLFFCGKELEIETENGIENKKCEKNSFICKKCMEINKKKYGLKNNYLININGRVAKINKGKFHCFGHFLSQNIIEDCIITFSCKACEIIDKYSDYYLSKQRKGSQ